MAHDAQLTPMMAQYRRIKGELPKETLLLFRLAAVDLTTGSFKTTEVEDQAALLAELERLRPAEVIFPGEAAALQGLLKNSFPITNGYDDWVFAPENAQFTVREHFKVAALDGFGLRNRMAAVGAAGAVLHYLTQHLRRDVAHLTSQIGRAHV